MKELHPDLSIGQLCGLFGISRQAYYNNKKRSTKKLLETDQVLKRIREIRLVHPRMGCRKIYDMIKVELHAADIKLGRDKLFDLLAENHMLIRNRRRRVWTTNSYHSFRKYKNLIKEFVPYQANQLWVSDITYIKNNEEFKYLFLITDAYSKKVVGYKFAQSLETEHAISSLKQALESTNQTEGLIHHSDRGIQYCSYNYVNLLQDYGIKISMTENSDPRENSIAERVNGILKQEYIEPLKKNKKMGLGEIIDTAIYRYNGLRPHMSCDMNTPIAAHKMNGSLKKRWKNYYKVKSININ
ncbi:MAG: IS3 family transposase [Winogradskyella sp.]|nr:IS3 family transposase [Winogradskyella sp.]